MSTVQCRFSEMCGFYGLKRSLSKGTLIKVAKKRQIDKIGAFLRISLQAITREHQKKSWFFTKVCYFFLQRTAPFLDGPEGYFLPKKTVYFVVCLRGFYFTEICYHFE